MAKNYKKGLDYFSSDVNFDHQLEMVIAKFGDSSFNVIFRTWQLIYKENGYFIEFNEDVVSTIKRACVEVTKEFIIEIIEYMVSKELFEQKIYEEYNVLTSKRVQRNYAEAIKRRKNVEVIDCYVCIPELIEYISNEIVGTAQQSKVKEIKEKKKETKEELPNNRLRQLEKLISDNLFIMKPLDYQTVSCWIDEQDFDIVHKAIKIGIMNRCSNLMYVDRILLNWKNAKLDTIQKVDEYISSFSKNNKNGKQRKEPDHLDITRETF